MKRALAQRLVAIVPGYMFNLARLNMLLTFVYIRRYFIHRFRRSRLLEDLF
jgi:hypothetical protein